MATYLDSNIICTKDGGDGFSTGAVYELLEVDGAYCAENGEGRQLEVFRGKNVVVAGNSEFDYWQ
ncbi:TPA: hypothetical protein SK268_001061 [Yersinia enterocolitica]|nr:hypothetical protein [Yersinia enterocolitica]